MTVERTNKVGTHRLRDSAVTSAKIADSTITAGDLATNAIQFELAVPLLTDSLSNSSTTPAAANERYLVSSELLNHAKAAYFEISYDASALTADGSAELYDVDAGAAVATITLTAGTTSDRTRSADILSSLTAGNEVVARVAGDGTNSATLRAARLILVLGVS